MAGEAAGQAAQVGWPLSWEACHWLLLIVGKARVRHCTQILHLSRPWYIPMSCIVSSYIIQQQAMVTCMATISSPTKCQRKSLESALRAAMSIRHPDWILLNLMHVLTRIHRDTAHLPRRKRSRHLAGWGCQGRDAHALQAG